MNPSNQPKITSSLLIVLLFVFATSLSNALATDLDGVLASANTADGYGVLINRTTGIDNSGFGFKALNADTSGSFNTAFGVGALFKNTTSNANTATGYSALYNNATGYNNTANGFDALASNTAGFRNAAVGTYALYKHVIGNYNNAVGAFALYSDITGNTNNAFGESALGRNISGSNNTAIGDDALFENTSGNSNIGVGAVAGANLTTGSYNVDIGNLGEPGESSTTRIGTSGQQTRTFIAGIYGVREGGMISPVYINSNGQLGTQPQGSSRRFKKEIKLMDNTSESILALKPVTFYYKSDDTNTLQYGLIAEEVAKVNPDLVVRDDNGEIYTVRYEAVNAMLLNEFLKEHRKAEALKKDLQATTAQQQKEIQALTAQLKEQAALIQKVSTQVEMNEPARKVVANKPSRLARKPAREDPR